jgi:hypothetical protein
MDWTTVSEAAGPKNEPPVLGTARKIAEGWRQAVLAKGGFQRVSQMDGADALGEPK